MLGPQEDIPPTGYPDLWWCSLTLKLSVATQAQVCFNRLCVLRNIFLICLNKPDFWTTVSFLAFSIASVQEKKSQSPNYIHNIHKWLPVLADCTVTHWLIPLTEYFLSCTFFPPYWEFQHVTIFVLFFLRCPTDLCRQTFWQPASHPDGKLFGFKDLNTLMSFSSYLFSYSSLVIQFLPRLLLGWWRQGKGLPLNTFVLLPWCSRSWFLSLLPEEVSIFLAQVAPKRMLRSFGLGKKVPSMSLHNNLSTTQKTTKHPSPEKLYTSTILFTHIIIITQ